MEVAMVKITCVDAGSLASKSGILPGDLLEAVNGNHISDVLDYRFYLTEKKVVLTLVRGEKRYKAKIKKSEYEDIGLEFETPLMDKKHCCKNGCIFCFIDQNPKGMRDTIYFKDDDSRLSFIHGNYVTLTNMTDEDVQRIIKMHISPINVSIHTTNPELRVKMMKNKRAGEVLRYLDDFAKAGISICGQIVLCRGVNDGEELVRTMTDLTEYFPALGSVSVVPAGLTKHREGLYPLSDFSAEEAAGVIDLVDGFAQRCKERFGSRIFFAADEFYLKSDRKIPPSECYEDYPQIENGVGLIRSFTDEYDYAEKDIKLLVEEAKLPRKVSVATGAASYGLISDIAARVTSLVPELKINVYKIRNDFFGESITVAGLLTGKDIFLQLKDKPLGDALLIPSSALKSDEDVFLCGMTLSELSDSLKTHTVKVDADGYAFLEALFGIV